MKTTAISMFFLAIDFRRFNKFPNINGLKAGGPHHYSFHCVCMSVLR